MTAIPKFPRRRVIAGALALIALVAAPALGDEDGKHDHDRARRALERGEVLPLERILAVVRARVPGEVVRVELEREDGTWIYEVRVLDAAGRRIEVHVDAARAVILKIKGR